MNINEVKTCLEALSEVIPQVSESSRLNLFNALAILKKEYAELSSPVISETKEDSPIEQLIHSFKGTITELNKKLKKLGYGTQGYILVYKVSKILAEIDVYQIQKDMEEKYSKNKATNILRSLALAGESVLRDVYDIAKSVNENPEEYVKYFKPLSEVEEPHEIDISSRAKNIITAKMVEEGVQSLERYFKENEVIDDEIPW